MPPAASSCSNALPLIAGSNTITAIATSPTGQTATATVTVGSTGAAPDLVLNADVTSGPSPLVVTFTYGFRPSQPVQKLAIDFDGDGRDDFSTKKPPSAVQNSYTHAGLYVATLTTITDRNGQVYKAAAAIEVTSGDGRDSLFHSVWDAMTASLARRDIAAALQSLNVRAGEKYAPIFNDLSSDLPAIVASYSDPAVRVGGAGLSRVCGRAGDRRRDQDLPRLPVARRGRRLAHGQFLTGETERMGLLLLLAMVLPSCVFAPPLYWGEVIQARVIDADTGQPVDGAAVVADWKLYGGGIGHGGHHRPLFVEETVTDANGEFTFGKWGPNGDRRTRSSTRLRGCYSSKAATSIDS